MRKIAQFFSIIFHPIFLPTYGFIYLIHLPYYVMFYTLFIRILLSISMIAIGIICPIAMMVILKKYGSLSSLYIDKREERTVPYAFMCWCFVNLIGLFFLLRFDIWVIKIFISICVCLVLMLIINRFWKISAHASGMGGLCGAIFSGAILWGQYPLGLMIFLLLASGCVLSSRLYLKKHTLAQVFAGYALGFCCTYVAGIL